MGEVAECSALKDNAGLVRLLRRLNILRIDLLGIFEKATSDLRFREVSSKEYRAEIRVFNRLCKGKDSAKGLTRGH